MTDNSLGSAAAIIKCMCLALRKLTFISLSSFTEFSSWLLLEDILHSTEHCRDCDYVTAGQYEAKIYSEA